MNGVEKIDFSVPNPSATAHFSLPLYQGASYNGQYSSWWINYVGGFMRFKLNLPTLCGTALILRLCSSLVDGKSDCPITITVNGQTLVSGWDPHNGNFYNKSWYMPTTMLRQGDNEIVVTLSGGSTAVFLQAASIMTFDMQHQQQTNWCWSAVSTSTSLFYDANSAWTQCSLANAELGQTTCCINGGSTECNQPWSLNSALSRTGNLASWNAGSEPVATVEGQTDEGRPLGARIGWSGGGGHFVMLTGVGNNETMVAVEDPWYGPSYIAYDTFKNNYKGSGSWTHSYFTQ